MLQPQSWGEDYSLHTSTSVVGEFARREFAFRLSSTATQSAKSLTGEKLPRQTAQFRAFPADNPYQGERITERICAQLPRFLHGTFA